MPGKIAAGHHTLADWDFSAGAVGRSLSTDYFISAPTSLKIQTVNGSHTQGILCRIPATLCLPEGEVRHWHRCLMDYAYPATFRNQAPLGTSNYLNCYLIHMFSGSTALYLWRAGVPERRDYTDGFHPPDGWRHFRVVWYNGKNPTEQEALCVDIYIEDAGEWVKLGDTLYDTLNWFKDSAVNRCGTVLIVHTGKPAYQDDTEIWGPV